MVNNLSMPERYFLTNFVRKPNRMTREGQVRMLKAFAEHFKPPFDGSPFQEMMDSLIRKGLMTRDGVTNTLTDTGKQVVCLMMDSKIPPFDFEQEEP